MTKIIEMKCPSCGANVGMDQNSCVYCRNPLIITDLNSLENIELSDLNKYIDSYTKIYEDNLYEEKVNLSLGLCLLKIGRYDQSLKSLERAHISSKYMKSDIFFYEAIAILGGKRAFLLTRDIVNKAIECLNVAISIHPKGIYYYFLSYLKFDYFFKKFLKVTPDYAELAELAKNNGVSEYDILQLYKMLKISRPNEL